MGSEYAAGRCCCWYCQGKLHVNWDRVIRNVQYRVHGHRAHLQCALAVCSRPHEAGVLARAKLGLIAQFRNAYARCPQRLAIQCRFTVLQLPMLVLLAASSNRLALHRPVCSMQDPGTDCMFDSVMKVFA